MVASQVHAMCTVQFFVMHRSILRGLRCNRYRSPWLPCCRIKRYVNLVVMTIITSYKGSRIGCISPSLSDMSHMSFQILALQWSEQSMMPSEKQGHLRTLIAQPSYLAACDTPCVGPARSSSGSEDLGHVPSLSCPLGG